jgi:hypothetical protein
VEAPAGCKFDFLTDSSECPSSALRDTRTTDAAHAADHDEPKTERENFEEETLSGSGVRERSVSRKTQMSAHVIRDNACRFVDDRYALERGRDTV